MAGGIKKMFTTRVIYDNIFNVRKLAVSGLLGYALSAVRGYMACGVKLLQDSPAPYCDSGNKKMEVNRFA